uniref:Uncharacterized protein n=1 Tax=Acrobeloides nanus TaxID=290746 RepID=A0A914C0V1_9BILA
MEDFEARELFEVSTLQLRAFGCTSKNVVDALHNAIIDAWAQVVENKILHFVRQKFQEDSRGDGAHESRKVERLRKQLLNHIYLNGKLQVFLNKLETHLMTYVFAIPRYITLPNDMANKECPNDEEELLETLKNLVQSIIELRYKTQIMDVESEKARNALKILRALKGTATASEPESEPMI